MTTDCQIVKAERQSSAVFASVRTRLTEAVARANPRRWACGRFQSRPETSGGWPSIGKNSRVLPNAATLFALGIALTAVGASAQPFDLVGKLSGYGTVRPYTGSTATLTNNGVLSPAPNGVLRIEGHLRQLLPGTLNFALAGTDPGTNHSRLNITGDAYLSGTLGVTLADGYLPNPGDTFNLMTYRSREGDFACFKGMLFLGENRRLITQFGPTNLALVTVTAPDPTNVVPRVTAQWPSAIVCWPAEFTGWQLYGTTNLATPQWQPLPGATNRWLEPVMAPAKYFRLGQP